jgi:hypothetical protein
MKKIYLIMALILMAGLCLSSVARATTSYNFACISEATIEFDGSGNFSFPNFTPNDFEIINASGVSSLAGSMGNLDGTFTIGEISGNEAPVTGSGNLILTVDSPYILDATIMWEKITTLSIGGLIAVCVGNLTNVIYYGTNNELQKFVADGGTILATFQFAQNYSLDDLKTKALATSYSGSFVATPLPPTLWLMASGLLGLAGWRRFRKG